MAASSVVQSPVLVDQDAHLALIGRRLDDAAAGRGLLLFVAGEAGIGKPRLLGVIARQAGIREFAVARAAAYPGDTQSLAGLLLDLASDLAAASAPALPQLPMGELRTRLLSQRSADEIRLPRLDVEQTATMTSATIGQQVPAQVVAAIHARSDGIPLHVEEILAAIGPGVLAIPGSSAAAQAAAGWPTCSRARIARRGHISPSRGVRNIRALIGDSEPPDRGDEVAQAGPPAPRGGRTPVEFASAVVQGAERVADATTGRAARLWRSRK